MSATPASILMRCSRCNLPLWVPAEPPPLSIPHSNCGTFVVVADG